MICGAIFMGSGALAASLILSREEVKKIRSSMFLYYFLLCSLFLTSFLLLGAEMYLDILIPWLVGATLCTVLIYYSDGLFKNLKKV
jgi:hypothetical protein